MQIVKTPMMLYSAVLWVTCETTVQYAFVSNDVLFNRFFKWTGVSMVISITQLSQQMFL